MKQAILKFIRDEEGLTATEYAVVAALIVSALVTAFTGLGNAITTQINDLANIIKSN